MQLSGINIHYVCTWRQINFAFRFSGITAEDMDGVTTTIRDVQAVLLSLFTEKTILIGHSLESDLVAVKVILNFMKFTF